MANEPSNEFEDDEVELSSDEGDSEEPSTYL